MKEDTRANELYAAQQKTAGNLSIEAKEADNNRNCHFILQ